MDEENLVRRRRTHRESRPHQFLRNYRIELLWLLIVAIGLFLLLEQVNLRSSVTLWAGETAHRLFQRVTSLDEQISGFLTQVSLSDLLGFALVLIAIVAILLRLRWRLLNTSRLTQLKCPRCDGSLCRTHRTGIDRLINVYVPVRRYRCRTDGCGWSGLRVGRGRSVSEHRDVRSAL